MLTLLTMSACFCDAARSKLLEASTACHRGVLNIVHGTHDTVNRICKHPDIKAISFVGSNAAGKFIYEQGSLHGKRVQVRAFAMLSPESLPSDACNYKASPALLESIRL